MVTTAQNINQNPGYKQTEIGEIPEDWEVCSLGDIVTKVGSGITPTGGEKVYKKEGHPFLRSQNVGWGHLLLDDIAFIDEETHSSFLATEIKLDDVLLNITGASIGRSAVADDRLLGGNVNQHVCIIRSDISKLNPYYLNFFLLSENGQKQIDSFQAGGNRQGLNFGQIKSFEIPLPSPPEQQAIVTALSDVDALLTSLDRLIAKKRDIKQATMHQLLTGKTRLPSFSGNWEMKRLGDIAEVGRGRVISNREVNASIEGKYPVYSSQTSSDGIMGYIDTFDFDGEYVTWTTDGVNAGTVFYRNGKFNCTNVCGTIKLKKDNPKFVAMILNKITPKYVSRNLANPKLMNDSLKKIKIPLPPFDEQTTIAAILSDMDAEIAALEQKRDKTRALKQGMMQELLTGKTRLL